MNITFAKIAVPAQGAVVFGVPEGTKSGVKLPPAAAKFDKQTKGALSRAIKAAEFTGKREKTLVIVAPAGAKVNRAVLVGLGNPKTLDETAAERIGAVIYDAVQRDAAAAVILEGLGGATATVAGLAAHVGGGAALKSYRFTKYRTKEDNDAKPRIKTVTIQTDDPAAAKKSYVAVGAVVAGVGITRDLITEPANIIYPESFVARAKDLAADGVKIDVLGVAAMKKLGMGALLGVGQGSVRDSQLLVLRWDGAADKKAAPLAIVGKGVCFDTGGISLKQPSGMWDMKWDMGGAGIVVGLMRALAQRKAPVNVVGLCGLVENMPDGNAQRPGDVVTSMSGQTIEVLNTDAEGRLVLADVLWYAQDRFKPKAIVDLATLTGAIIMALAEHYAGLFSNNDALSEQLAAAGKAVGERLWRFPMGDEYDKDLRSPIADMKNIGGGKAGSITAAQFLQRFIKAGTPWAHLDIAGVVWNEKGTALAPGGATGYGVRLLNRFIAENYEK
ncbi:MAG: leucyl aminopeptidase [Rhodospirillaceae bacterium]|nr:leucyl aminopeptidase [Rhodospirillaceae bacterium]